MENVEYIIVGDGYAALFFAHRLMMARRSFVLFSEGRKSASRVSAGIINPVVLKKFTTFWKAQEQIDELKKMLQEIQGYTGENYLIDAPVHRIFHDENEQKLWHKKSGTEELSQFLDQNFDRLEGVKNDFLTGKVVQSARLDVNGFFTGLFGFLEKESKIIKERFDYSRLNVQDSMYGKIKYRHIVFCEGMGVKDNPYFSSVPVQPNKGHHIKVKLSEPVSGEITVKKKHFLFPLNGGLFFYGGTYDREQLHHRIDDAAVEQLTRGLAEIYPYDFEIAEASFGFRPTVKDRRPIIGRHAVYGNLYVFNGMGARGILNGSYFSGRLFNFIENGIPLDQEVSPERFG